MTIREWQTVVHQQSRDSGFYDVPFVNIDQKLLLAVGELIEAHEELRKGNQPTYVYYRADGKPEGFGTELADTVIRIFDLAEHLGIDLEERIREKHEFNGTRSYKHGRAF